MSSLYLSRLSKDDRKQLEQQLWSQQSGKCFISEEPIDLALEEVDIDHVIPMRDNGKDDPSNFRADAFSLQSIETRCRSAHCASAGPF
jgi:hypothetical protein